MVASNVHLQDCLSLRVRACGNESDLLLLILRVECSKDIGKL